MSIWIGRMSGDNCMFVLFWPEKKGANSGCFCNWAECDAPTDESGDRWPSRMKQIAAKSSTQRHFYCHLGWLDGNRRTNRLSLTLIHRIRKVIKINEFEKSFKNTQYLFFIWFRRNDFGFRFARHRVIKQMQKLITHHTHPIRSILTTRRHRFISILIKMRRIASEDEMGHFQHGRRVILSCEKSNTSFIWCIFGANLHLFCHLNYWSLSFAPLAHSHMHIAQYPRSKINSKDSIPSFGRLSAFRSTPPIN